MKTQTYDLSVVIEASDGEGRVQDVTKQEAKKGCRRFEHKINKETFRVDTVIDRQKLILALIGQ